MSKRDKTGLSGKQRAAAEKLANPTFEGSVTELCEQIGVSRASFYRWMDKPEFRDYLNGLIDKYSDSELAAVWKALVRKCTSGDTRAMKLYFELKGRFGDKPSATQEDDPLTHSLKEALDK